MEQENLSMTWEKTTRTSFPSKKEIKRPAVSFCQFSFCYDFNTFDFSCKWFLQGLLQKYLVFSVKKGHLFQALLTILCTAEAKAVTDCAKRCQNAQKPPFSLVDAINPFIYENRVKTA